MNGSFDQVGVYVMQLPVSSHGNQYDAVSWIKWPEVCPTNGQFAYSIANLLVKGVIAQLGVCSILLSDRGSPFLSKLLQEVY